MNELKTVTERVRSILERDEKCRNSDSFLYLQVLTEVGKEKGIDIEKMSIPYFFLNLHGAGLPPFESVRRARQKIQAAHPELAACERVRGYRAENETEYRAFAVGDCDG